MSSISTLPSVDEAKAMQLKRPAPEPRQGQGPAQRTEAMSDTETLAPTDTGSDDEGQFGEADGGGFARFRGQRDGVARPGRQSLAFRPI